MNILLTGGAGYIGSHTYAALVEASYTPVILDNFSNSHPEVLKRLEKITNQRVLCEEADILDVTRVEEILRKYNISGVVHFAGDKSVGESVSNPLKYYHNNIGGATSLLRAMASVGCQALVFSSSATVYGDPASVPITEYFPRSHTNPYGHTKLVIEDMLYALCGSTPDWKVAVLRYFNPVGAHSSGLIGENPTGVPNNLMPFIAQVAAGRRSELQVLGSDYSTRDGTGVRDYIHVSDLAAGHVAALKVLFTQKQSFTVNLGTGLGHSVLEMIAAFELASGMQVPYRLVARRPGDVAQCYADPTKAQQLLNWQATRSLHDMCVDTWRWQSKNPLGYSSRT